jgi:hypothetical protein
MDWCLMAKEILSRINLKSIVWAREFYDLEGSLFDLHFWDRCRHSFSGLAIVAVEINDEKIVNRAWAIDCGVPGITPPLDISSPSLVRPAKMVTVFAASIKPEKKTELYNPEKNTHRYCKPLDSRPDRWLLTFEKHVAPLYVMRVGRVRRFLRWLGRGFRRVVKWLRGSRCM